MKIGDVVVLNSDPNNKMTVDGMAPGGFIGCVWFDGNGNPIRCNFSENSLRLVSEIKTEGNPQSNESLLLG